MKFPTYIMSYGGMFSLLKVFKLNKFQYLLYVSVSGFFVQTQIKKEGEVSFRYIKRVLTPFYS